MIAILARVVSLKIEPFPGWAHVVFESTGGRSLELHDKQPVLGIKSQQLGEVVHLDCEVVREESDRVTVRLLHGVETTDGLSTVEVNRDQLVGL